MLVINLKNLLIFILLFYLDEKEYLYYVFNYSLYSNFKVSYFINQFNVSVDGGTLFFILIMDPFSNAVVGILYGNGRLSYHGFIPYHGIYRLRLIVYDMYLEDFMLFENYQEEEIRLLDFNTNLIPRIKTLEKINETSNSIYYNLILIDDEINSLYKNTNLIYILFNRVYFY